MKRETFTYPAPMSARRLTYLVAVTVGWGVVAALWGVMIWDIAGMLRGSP